MNTIGIDISKEWFDCYCWQRQLDRRFTNNHNGWKAFKDWIIDEEVHVIMEASGPYYLGLASYLYEQGIKVSVVNPLVIRRYRQIQAELEDNITRIDKRMETLAAEHYEEVMEALLTIPGIGRKTAIELVTVTDGFWSLR